MKLSIVNSVGKVVCLASILFTFSNPLWAQDCSHQDGSFKCVNFVRNYDGDTIVVDIPRVHSFFGSQIAVRIRGIDTGEIKNRVGKPLCELEMALMAKEEVERLFLRANDLELRNVARGKYFRVLADVYVNKRSVAKHLIKKGLAVAYNGGGKQDVDWCKLKQHAEELVLAPSI